MRALGYVAWRMLGALGTLAVLSLLLFVGSEALPGDAASALPERAATTEEVARLRQELGLDQPLVARYVDWAASALRGDLGHSIVTGRPVTDLLTEPAEYSAVLVLLSAVVSVLFSLVIGVIAGLRPGSRLDRVLSAGALVVVSIPQFVTASFLVALFAVTWGLLPAVSLVPLGGGPLDRPEILVLPVLSLSLFATAWASQLVRATVVDAGAAPNVEAARLAGLPERTVIWRHLMPATVPPLAQMFAWLLSGLVGGTAIVERVFSYPGLSGVLVDAVRQHDPAVLEGVGLLMAALLILGLLLADVIGVLATPRLPTASA